MITVLTENDDRMSKINATVAEAANIMSLGSGIGFRQISGIDVISNIQGALRTIEGAHADSEDGEYDGRYAYLARKTATDYLKKADISIDELKQDINDLAKGLDKISSILYDLLSEANSLS